jgi:3-oxoacyl-[acyl-carrier protein] reductase
MRHGPRRLVAFHLASVSTAVYPRTRNRKETTVIDSQLEGKVVLITGANHGIGAATAEAFAEQDAKVFVAYYRPECPYSQEELEKAREDVIGGDALYRAMHQQSGEQVVERIRGEGGMAFTHESDLREADTVPALFDLCEQELGAVDILVNNHTYCVCDTFDPALVTDEGLGISLVTAANIDATFAVNARAYALMMAEYLRRYRARGASWGRIINLSTDAAHQHLGNISYAASKHAIESYSRSAAKEMGEYGITVNIIAPGPVQTGYIMPESEKEIAATTPLRRVGRPEDVADVIVFLASEQAHWLTGQLLYVGGGYRMHQ